MSDFAISVSHVFKNYRQRLLNTRVMLTLRRALFDRLLHLPLPRLWDMKTYTPARDGRTLFTYNGPP